MAPQRPPSSPTALLWAHQLKREHGFLLDRMKKLETEIAGVESRTKAAVNTARANEIASIAEKVQSLTDHGGRTAVKKIREKVMERFEDVGAEIEAVMMQVSDLGRSQEALKEENRRAAQSEKTLLKRIKEMESSTKEYESSLRKLDRKVDDQAVDKIRGGLEGLSEDVKNNRIAVETVHASLETLNAASRALREGNERLAEQVKELADRPAPVPVPVPLAVAATQSAATDPPAILHEPEATEEDASVFPMPAKKERAAKKTTAKAAPKPRRKPAEKQSAAKTQPPLVRGVARVKVDKKEPLIDDRLKVPIVRRGRGWVEVVEGPDEDENKPEASAILESAGRRARRAVMPLAKGVSTVLSTPPTKRGPGRLRKGNLKSVPVSRRSITQPDEGLQLSTDPQSTIAAPPLKRGPGRPRKAVGRRTIVQPYDESLPAKKRPQKLQPVLNGSLADSEVLSTYDQKKAKATDFVPDPLEPPKKKQRRGLSNIFTSPMSSSIEPVESLEPVLGPSGKGHIFQSETSQPTPGGDKQTIRAQPPKRRTIVQLDDETSLS